MSTPLRIALALTGLLAVGAGPVLVFPGMPIPVGAAVIALQLVGVGCLFWAACSNR